VPVGSRNVGAAPASIGKPALVIVGSAGHISDEHSDNRQAAKDTLSARLVSSSQAIGSFSSMRTRNEADTSANWGSDAAAVPELESLSGSYSTLR
jgi:hypothetical protein